MHFSKYFVGGKSLLFIPDEKDFNSLSKSDIFNLCVEQKGVGADGIFSFCEISPKTAQIKAFDCFGNNTLDLSSALICGVFEANSNRYSKRIINLPENYDLNSFFLEKEDKFGNIIFDLGKISNNDLYRKNIKNIEIGNRILSLYPIELFSLYGIHFSDNKNLLDINYLGKHFSKNSIYEKRGNLILGERVSKNCFDFGYYENSNENANPNISAFGAFALACCLTGKADFDKELKITYNGNQVYAYCKKDLSVSVICNVHKLFEGNT